jgi:8-oxo-dGTP diphosphatase
MPMKPGSMDDDHDKGLATFAVSADVVALMIRNQQLSVLLVERGEQPFKRRWALPGGLLRRDPLSADETLDAAARRQLAELPGTSLGFSYLAQLGTYGDPGRDPRGDVVSVAYLAVVYSRPTPRVPGLLRMPRWYPVSIAEEAEGALAFDHGRILADGLRRAYTLIETTAFGVAFCKEWFTMTHLRQVYENVWDLPSDSLDAGNFHHRIMGLPGLVEPVSEEELAMKAAWNREAERRLGIMATPDSMPGGRGRPARWFKRGPLIREGGAAVLLERPFIRPRG